MGYQVVEAQPTPNPNAVKFMLDRTISEKPISFFNAEAAKGHELGEKLFGIAGVTSVLILNDFVTINKKPEAKWKTISQQVEAVLQGAR